MRKAITVNIPEPCHEDWNKMTPKDQGRHCAACNKTVVDFTKQTDEQIITTLESTENLCGRFKNKQLNREIVLARKDKNHYLSWAASGLFAFLALGNQDIHAQGSPKTEQIDSVRTPQVKGKIAKSILNEKVYSGIITTKIDGLPLPGASVIIKGTDNGAQTDFNGEYSIAVKIGDTLVVSYVGMKPQEFVISYNTKVNAALIENEQLNEAIIVGGMISYTPAYTYHCNIDNSDESYIWPEEKELKIKKNKEAYQAWKKNNKARRTKWKAENIAKRVAIRNGEQERTTFGKFFFGIKSLFSKK